MSIKENKISLIQKLSNDYTKIISRKEISLYKNIDWGNNGIGDRFCNGYFNYLCIYNHKYKVYCDMEIEINIEEIKKFQEENSDIGIIGIKILSIRKKKLNRPVKESIKTEICKRSCVVCGSNSYVICDHKNDLYDDSRVLCVKTQVLNDFQSLCNHCNLQKRQVCKKEKELHKIYSAKNIPQLNILNIDFPWEKTNSKSESYWYDPVEFYRKIKLYTMFIPCIKELKNSFKKSTQISSTCMNVLK